MWVCGQLEIYDRNGKFLLEPPSSEQKEGWGRDKSPKLVTREYRGTMATRPVWPYVCERISSSFSRPRTVHLGQNAALLRIIVDVSKL